MCFGVERPSGGQQVHPSSSEQGCWPALLQINQHRSCAFISQGHSSILPGERGMHWRVTHIHQIQSVRCFPEVHGIRAKAQHAAIWEMYRNTFSLYTFQALFSEASLSILFNINAHIHCSYFKVHVSCYEISISPFTTFSSDSL